jgi:hypothetical protein
MPPDVGTTMSFRIGGERAASGNARLTPSVRPFVTKSETELDNLESANIIRKVIKPTAWVHPFLVPLKKNGDIRLVIDFRELNKCIIRPNFETATPFQAVRTIPPGMKFFTIIDALKGYR